MSGFAFSDFAKRARLDDLAERGRLPNRANCARALRLGDRIDDSGRDGCAEADRARRSSAAALGLADLKRVVPELRGRPTSYSSHHATSCRVRAGFRRECQGFGRLRLPRSPIGTICCCM
jgi:hypothetical protein